MRLLAAHTRCHGPIAGPTGLAGLAPSTVHDILNTYLEHRAPVFAERKAEVIEVYAATIRSLFDSPLSRQN